MVGSVVGLGELDGLDFAKGGGLLPAVVQDAGSGAVLTLGYMNRDAVFATLTRRKVVFFSRSKNRLWEKGESSGHALDLEHVRVDCDHDTLLVAARPRGPVCHLGSGTCFGEAAASGPSEGTAFLSKLEEVIGERAAAHPEASYTAKLLASGWMRIAQKVGEEGLEAALAGAGGTDSEVVAEVADLFYHVLVLLKARGLNLERVLNELRTRHAAKSDKHAS
jgi:phosphoribosyl-ATP pyrophosphohydrolase/phosphoribosyl-AMP cyclohydrolase